MPKAKLEKSDVPFDETMRRLMNVPSPQTDKKAKRKASRKKTPNAPVRPSR
jgi:hypothetical protein